MNADSRIAPPTALVKSVFSALRAMYVSLHPPSCAAILPSPTHPGEESGVRATPSLSENYMTLFNSDGVIEASGHIGEAPPEVTDARPYHRRRRQDGAGRVPEDPTATDEGRYGPVRRWPSRHPSRTQGGLPTATASCENAHIRLSVQLPPAALWVRRRITLSHLAAFSSGARLDDCILC